MKADWKMQLLPDHRAAETLPDWVRSPRQVTDGHLLDLAQANTAQLATTDAGIPGAFLINGGKTVMIREGKSRLPIKALQTIDVAQMFNTKRINAKVVQLIEERFPGIFANDVKFFVSRFNASR